VNKQVESFLLLVLEELENGVELTD